MRLGANCAALGDFVATSKSTAVVKLILKKCANASYSLFNHALIASTAASSPSNSIGANCCADFTSSFASTLEPLTRNW